jgi:hypothetical protein
MTTRTTLSLTLAARMAMRTYSAPAETEAAAEEVINYEYALTIRPRGQYGRE